MTLRPQISLGELIGGMTLLMITLGLFLPDTRDVVEFFRESPELQPKVLALMLSAVGVVVFTSQIFYWVFLVPLIRWIRNTRRSRSE